MRKHFTFKSILVLSLGLFLGGVFHVALNGLMDITTANAAVVVDPDYSYRNCPGPLQVFDYSWEQGDTDVRLSVHTYAPPTYQKSTVCGPTIQSTGTTFTCPFLPAPNGTADVPVELELDFRNGGTGWMDATSGWCKVPK